MGEAIANADTSNADQHGRFAQFYVTRADARLRTGVLGGALSDFQQAASIYEKQAAKDRNNLAPKLRMAGCLAGAGKVEARAGHLDEATIGYRDALGIAEPYAAANPPNPQALYTVANSYSGLGYISERTKQERGSILLPAEP